MSKTHVISSPAFSIVIFLAVFSAIPVWAQTTQQPAYSAEQASWDFFAAPLVEVIGFGRKALAIGGGFALGTGDRAALGFRLLYAVAPDAESVTVLELAAFTRFYFFKREDRRGPFAQLNVGAALYAYKSAVSFPAKAGTISVGLAAGWRFPFGNHWYVEPAVRAGYPYMFGGGVSAGFRL